MKPSIDRPRSVPRMSIMNVLRGRAGIEVSVTNIIVAIGVSLAVMIGVAASVIYVLPWAQNSQAQSDLSSIQSAETTYFSQKAPVAYGTVAELVAENALLKSEKRVPSRCRPTSRRTAPAPSPVQASTTTSPTRAPTRRTPSRRPASSA